MPDSEVHSAKLVDVPALRRLADQCMVLDSELCYTRRPDFSRSGLISSVIMPQQRGIYTLVGRHGRLQAYAQLRIKLDDRLGQIVFIGPMFDDTTSDSAWLAVLDGMAAEAGRHGATILTAEVDEISPAFETMRQANFAVYARQEIWRRAGETSSLRLAPLSGQLADETDDDTMDIQLLYSNIVPRLVQPIAVPSPESHGIVYRRNDRVQAYVAVSQGKQGIYLMPFLHPDVLGREALSIIEGVLSRIDEAERAPVYVCVRRYQDWLADALGELGFEPWARQAVMVRHVAAGIRQQAYALPAAAALERVPTSLTSPFQRSTKLDSDTGESSPAHGTTNYG